MSEMLPGPLPLRKEVESPGAFGGFVDAPPTNKVAWTPANVPPGAWIRTDEGKVLLVRSYNHPDGVMGMRWFADVRVYQSHPTSEEVTLRLGTEQNVQVPQIKDNGEPYLIEVIPVPPGGDEALALTTPVNPDLPVPPEGGMDDPKIFETPDQVFPVDSPDNPGNVEGAPDPIAKMVTAKGKCPEHPGRAYKHKPRSGCPVCLFLYNRHQEAMAAELAKQEEKEAAKPVVEEPPIVTPQQALMGYIVSVIDKKGVAFDVDATELVAGLGRLLVDFHTRLSSIEKTVVKMSKKKE